MNGLIAPARHFNPENLVKTPFHVVVRSRNYLPYNNKVAYLLLLVLVTLMVELNIYAARSFRSITL